jgi:hypothetical protein
LALPSGKRQTSCLQVREATATARRDSGWSEVGQFQEYSSEQEVLIVALTVFLVESIDFIVVRNDETSHELEIPFDSLYAS